MEYSLQRMKELVETLNQASKAYYQEDRELMSNQEYDSLYDQLEQLEKETGTVLTNSPTVRVGYEADKGQGSASCIHWKPQKSVILEAGWSDHCTYL